MSRPETGTMQFGDDWPGVFIRGDNAGWYAMMLQGLLDDLEDSEQRDSYGIAIITLRGLVNLLSNSNVEVADPQLLKPFDECSTQ